MEASRHVIKHHTSSCVLNREAFFWPLFTSTTRIHVRHQLHKHSQPTYSRQLQLRRASPIPIQPPDRQQRYHQTLSTLNTDTSIVDHNLLFEKHQTASKQLKHHELLSELLHFQHYESIRSYRSHHNLVTHVQHHLDMYVPLHEQEEADGRWHGFC